MFAYITFCIGSVFTSGAILIFDFMVFPFHMKDNFGLIYGGIFADGAFMISDHVMHPFDMDFECPAVVGFICTGGTRKSFNFFMHTIHMFLHVAFHRKHFPTLFTLMWL